MSEERTAFRTCPLCEAGCGLEISVVDGQVGRIRGDRADVFSRGYICPKGSTLKQLHDDPDRLRVPLIKEGDTRGPGGVPRDARGPGGVPRDARGPGGVPRDSWREASWDEAFAEIERRLGAVVERHGRQALAVYLGNPNAHNLAGAFYVRPLVKALGTRNVFSASTVDQRPKEIAAGLMFGTALSVPVPDVDRTDYLLVLGANPYISNGSLATAPDWPGRLDALVARGGRLVIVDPRRSRTAEAATEHISIRPGADAHLLMAMVNVLFAEELVDLGPAGPWLAGAEALQQISRPFTPEAVAGATGIDAGTTRRLTRELAAAPAAAVYGRIGTTTVEFGTLTSWLVDVVNALTGNLDRPGGAMFPKAAAGAANTRGASRYGRGVAFGRWASRVRGLPEAYGELPVVCLAEEIEIPGEGQVRALVTVAGNPVLSTPDGARLDSALAGLEFMVSVDCYLNETTRHADVILPVPSPLQKGHYDVFLYQLALRNVANYSPPTLPLDDGQLDEWEVLSRLTLAAAGNEPAAVERRRPEEILDQLLRAGPYGDELNLDVLLSHPHGVDLGPLQPRLPEVLRTPSGLAELAPEPLLADVARLEAALHRPTDTGLVMVGRRQLRSNNSWMHNLSVLVKGRPRCTLQVNPEDAARLGVADGEKAEVASASGNARLVVAVEVTGAIRPGVVSLPHGWGHDLPGVRLGVAAAHAGVNSNLLAGAERYDPLSGNAVLNGIPVVVSPLPQESHVENQPAARSAAGVK